MSAIAALQHLAQVLEFRRLPDRPDGDATTQTIGFFNGNW
jgi:hypothetical protein